MRRRYLLALGSDEAALLQHVVAVYRYDCKDRKRRARLFDITLALNELSRTFADSDIDIDGPTAHAQRMSFTEAAAALNVCNATIGRYAKVNKLTKVGRQVTVESVAAYLDDTSGSTSPPLASLRRERSRRQPSAKAPEGMAVETDVSS